MLLVALPDAALLAPMWLWPHVIRVAPDFLLRSLGLNLRTPLRHFKPTNAEISLDIILYFMILSVVDNKIWPTPLATMTTPPLCGPS
jgi:hypothetical protein